MARYLDLVATAGDTGTININFPIRAEFRVGKEYFEDFILGGGRFDAVRGLTRVRPELTIEYEPVGFRLLQKAVQMTVPQYTARVHVDGTNISIQGALIDTWEITFEEGRAANVRMGLIGTLQASDAPVSVGSDFSLTVPTVTNSQVLVGGSTVKVNRWSLRINNNCQPLYYGNTVPATVQVQNCEITGRLRFQDFVVPSEGAVEIRTPIGTITLSGVRFEEIPPSARGWEVPETEVSFRASSLNVAGELTKD
jgi:hypothetical protein